MARKLHRSRTEFPLNSSLSKRLLAYVSAAGAAGVGMLVLAKPAEAKIVYTRANESLGQLTMLDLNNDGIPDFEFCIRTNSDSCPSSGRRGRGGKGRPGPITELFVSPPVGASKQNQIWGNPVMFPSAYALPAGALIGPKTKFTRGGKFMAGCAAATTSSCGGFWSDAPHRYLALKFVIGGEIHYGWARLNVIWNLTNCCTATLTGYAYETIANKPILTGDIVGSEKPRNTKEKTPEMGSDHLQGATNHTAGSLGLLATGAAGLIAWRKKDESVRYARSDNFTKRYW